MIHRALYFFSLLLLCSFSDCNEPFDTFFDLIVEIDDIQPEYGVGEFITFTADIQANLDSRRGNIGAAGGLFTTQFYRVAPGSDTLQPARNSFEVTADPGTVVDPAETTDPAARHVLFPCNETECGMSQTIAALEPGTYLVVINVGGVDFNRTDVSNDGFSSAFFVASNEEAIQALSRPLFDPNGRNIVNDGFSFQGNLFLVEAR